MWNRWRSRGNEHGTRQSRLGRVKVAPPNGNANSQLSHRNEHTTGEDAGPTDERADQQRGEQADKTRARSSPPRAGQVVLTLSLLLVVGFGVALMRQLRAVSNELASLRRESTNWQQTELLNVIYSRGENAAHERVRSNAVKTLLDLNGDGSAEQSGFDLSQAPLDGLSLQDSNLRRVNFSRASLEQADLSRARLRRAVFTNAQLRDTKMIEVIAPNAQFHDSVLIKTNLRSADLRATEFDSANLTRAILKYARCPRASFRNAILTGANLQEANLSDANLCDADLQKADLRIANLQRARLARAVLRGANFEMVNLKDASMHDADVAGANFRGVTGLTAEQIKTTRNWQKANYSNKMATALGLSTSRS